MRITVTKKPPLPPSEEPRVCVELWMDQSVARRMTLDDFPLRTWEGEAMVEAILEHLIRGHRSTRQV